MCSLPVPQNHTELCWDYELSDRELGPSLLDDEARYLPATPQIFIHKNPLKHNGNYM
jgi:hypothetical protein